MENAGSEKSTIRVIVHSFFVVPFLIAAFGVLIFFIWSLLTYESKSIEEYIVDVKIGGATKRWQSAYELSRLLDEVCDFDVQLNMNNKNEVEFLSIKNDTIKKLKSGSGLETTLASLSLRCVLVRISTLPKPNIIVFDEVLG